MRKFGVALASGVLLLTAGCGDGGDRPSADEISQAIRGSAGKSIGVPDGLDKSVADCMGKAIEKSRLSDKALRALVDGDKNFKGSKSDDTALISLIRKISECQPQ